MTTGLPRPLSNTSLQFMKLFSGGRPTAALIDLDVLSGNYQAVQAALGPERELLAVVKAEGYGHGAAESAQAFIDAGAAWLGVATVEEGEALRSALNSEDAGRYGGVRILMMSGASPELAPRIVSANLDAVVWDLNQVEALSAAAGAAGRLARIHLKVDSGMHRLGVTPGDAPEFIRKAAALDRVEVEGLMSHLAQADEESGENPTRAQFAIILALIDDLRGGGDSSSDGPLRQQRRGACLSRGARAVGPGGNRPLWLSSGVCAGSGSSARDDAEERRDPCEGCPGRGNGGLRRNLPADGCRAYCRGRHRVGGWVSENSFKSRRGIAPGRESSRGGHRVHGHADNRCDGHGGCSNWR